MPLILLILVPLAAGLLCLTTRSRAWWERLNLAAFVLVACLAFKVAGDVAGHGTISALNVFLRADALSALVLGLTGFVSLVCAIYAVGYFRREVSEGRVTRAQLRRDRKSTRLNSSHQIISYAVFCLKKKKKKENRQILSLL